MYTERSKTLNVDVQCTLGEVKHYTRRTMYTERSKTLHVDVQCTLREAYRS